jgi:hypothetical protein
MTLFHLPSLPYFVTVKPVTTKCANLPIHFGEIIYLLICSFLLSFLVVALPISQVPEGRMNYLVYKSQIQDTIEFQICLERDITGEFHQNSLAPTESWLIFTRIVTNNEFRTNSKYWSVSSRKRFLKLLYR